MANDGNSTSDPNLSGILSAWGEIKNILPGPDRLKTAIAWLFALMIVAIVVTAFLSASAGILAIIFVPFLLISVLAIVNFLNCLFPTDKVGFRKRFASAVLGTFAVALGWIFIVGFEQASQEVRRTIPIEITDWSMRNLYEINSKISAAAIIPHIPALERNTPVDDADDLLAFERLSREAGDWSPNGTGNPSVKEIMKALTLSDHVRFLGKIDIIQRSANDKVIIVGARELFLDDNTVLSIGQSNLVLVAETLTVGKGSKILAFPRIDRTRPPDDSDHIQPPQTQALATGSQARSAGNFTLVVTGKIAGPPLEIDLRGEDGANGVPGANGKNGIASEEAVLAPREAYGIKVELGKAEGLGKLRWDIDRFRNSRLGAMCKEECNETIKKLIDWAMACQETGCPKNEVPVCLYFPPSPALSPPTAKLGGGQIGQDGGLGQRGGNGGRVAVFLSKSVESAQPVVLTPEPANSRGDPPTKDNAASGGAGGPKGIGGRPAPIESIVDINGSGACSTTETSTPFSPAKDGIDGKAGQPGEPHSYAGHPSEITF
ncbi:hypothetical protein ACCT28_36470 [Rhizobium ruizarguesonis]